MPQPPQTLVSYDPPLPIVGSEGAAGSSQDLVAGDGSGKTASKENTVLEMILPSRRWQDTDGMWMQTISSEAGTRFDVMTLQEKLDDLLYSKQARDTGICPIREELHSQVFDELIRQLTIECEDRGMMLLRVRDQIRLSIAAYQTLYHTSVAFGTRKILQAEGAVV